MGKSKDWCQIVNLEFRLLWKVFKTTKSRNNQGLQTHKYTQQGLTTLTDGLHTINVFPFPYHGGLRRPYYRAGSVVNITGVINQCNTCRPENLFWWLSHPRLYKFYWLSLSSRKCNNSWSLSTELAVEVNLKHKEKLFDKMIGYYLRQEHIWMILYQLL